ncbi:MAG: hypothetical protein KAR19_01820 [Bacteroidales bacterium]|nr:hypothetical protein [Bacteroidales bacterium]
MRGNKLYTIIPILPFILLLVSIPVAGQQSNTFYLMHQVPQSNLLNPAVQLQCKWYVGIPGLASSHFSYNNTAFTYNDLAGSNTWNIDGVFDQMHRVDLFAAEALLNLVSVGYRYKSLYFTFNIIEKTHVYQTVPKDLAEMALYGNGPFIGETTRFNATRSAGYYNREYSLGISKVMDQNWTVGLRGKLLFGKANLYSSRSDIDFTTRENNFDLLLEGDYTLNSSFPVTITQDAEGNIDGITLNEINYVRMLLNRGNPGFAFDLGIIYRYDDRITLSASLLDVGMIRWRTDLNNVSGAGSFEYVGADPGTDIISFDFLADIRDSLLNSFDVSVSQAPYFSYLPAQLFLGGSFHIRENIKLGLVNRNVIFHSKAHSSVTLSANADLADRILATVSWSYLNNSIKNIGAGLAYHGKGFQLHLVSDNLLGFFYPFDTRSVNLRAGFNVMFGCPRNKKEKLESESYGPMPMVGNCSPAVSPKKRERQIKRASRQCSRL